jgi:5-methylcytosine-specific restriction endonuclease McrA
MDTMDSDTDDAKPRRRGLPYDVRMAVYYRDGWKCVLCGSDRELSVDHIVEVSKGGTDDLSNLRALCKVCHHGRHNQPRPRPPRFHGPQKVDKRRLLPRFRSGWDMD